MTTTSTKTSRVLSLVAGCSALLGGWACQRPAATQPAGTPPAASKPALPPFEVSGPGWEDGTHYVYQVTLTNRTELSTGNTLVDFRLNADLDLYASRNEDGAIELASRLDHVRVDGGRSQSEKDKKNLEHLGRDLAKPWFQRLQEGRVVEARFVPGASAAAVTVQRSLGAALQFVGPAASGSTVTQTGKAWASAEHDATGKYQAEYRVGEGTGRFSKRKLRYDSALLGLESPQPSVRLAAPLPNLTPEVVSSTADLAVEGGSLRSVKQNEELKAKLGQGMPVTSKTSLTLVLTTSRATRPGPQWAQAGAATVRVRATEPYAPPLPPLDTDGAKMAGWTFERAVAELEDLERTRVAPEPAPEGGLETQSAAQNARAERASRAFGALGAILRRDAKAVPRVVALIRKKSIASRALLDALATSASGLSQSALVELATDGKLPEKVRKSAAGSLIRTDQPTDKTVAALIPLLDDPVLGVYATYGLGTYARKLREHGDVERSRKISELLVRRLGMATKEGNRITILRGIANSGYVGALETVRPYLTNESASLRAAAVQALRLMNHPQVDELIVARLQERKALVRNAALSALSPRPVTPALLGAVERVAASSEDSQGRMEGVRLLGQWVREGTSVRATLDKVARTDAEPKVRDEARRALERS